MSEIFCELPSRHNQPRYLHKTNGEWFIEGQSYFVRGGGTENGGTFVDFEGGPFISTSSKLSDFVDLSAHKLEDATITGFQHHESIMGSPKKNWFCMKLLTKKAESGG